MPKYKFHVYLDTGTRKTKKFKAIAGFKNKESAVQYINDREDTCESLEHSLTTQLLDYPMAMEKNQDTLSKQ